MKIIFKIILILLLSIGLIILIKYAIHCAKQTYIQAEFTELTPFTKKMPVYFKGYKIGKVTKITPKDDFTSTLMNITLFPEKISLPQNIFLQVRSNKQNLTYAEIIIPEIPSIKRLNTGDIIEGKSNISLNSIMERQAENGSFESIFANIGDIAESFSSAMKELDGLIKDIRITFKNNESYITVTTRNLSQTTSHLTRTSLNISNTVDQATLDRTMKNLEITSYNLKNITGNIDCATRNIGETMEHVNGITENVDSITNNINCTLKDRFGGLRLIFGKPKQKCKCKNKN